jgi:CelD/BcsL family acetyltransferase involved in cellulose biosynthesis
LAHRGYSGIDRAAKAATLSRGVDMQPMRYAAAIGAAEGAEAGTRGVRPASRAPTPPTRGAPKPDSVTDLRCTVLTRFEDFAALEAAWNELYAATRQRTANLHFSFIAAAWEAVCQPQGDAFRCILIHDGDQMVGGWPFALRRRGRGVAAYLPGTGPNEEYGDPLIRGGARELDTARAFLAPLGALADSCWLFNLRDGSPMDRAAREARALYIHRETARSPILEAPISTTREAWLAGKSRSFRQGLAYDRRRLAQLGPVAFRDVDEACERDATIDWIFATKRAALGAAGKTWSWVFDDGAVALLKRAAANCSDIRVCVLGVAGETAAAAILLDSPGTLEYFVTAYNPAHRAYSPGNLMVEALVQGCFEDGRAFDFRLTDAPYKRRWIDGVRPHNHYVLGVTPHGAWLAWKYSARRATARLRIATKARLDALRERLRPSTARQTSKSRPTSP